MDYYKVRTDPITKADMAEGLRQIVLTKVGEFRNNRDSEQRAAEAALTRYQAIRSYQDLRGASPEVVRREIQNVQRELEAARVAYNESLDAITAGDVGAAWNWIKASFNLRVAQLTLMLISGHEGGTSEIPRLFPGKM